MRINNTILVLFIISLLCLFTPLPSPGAVQEYMSNASETIPQKVSPWHPAPVALYPPSSTGGSTATTAPTQAFGAINTNPINGFSAPVTVAATTTVAIICPALPNNTRKIWITSSCDVNIGDATIGTALGTNWIPANCPGFQYSIATTTPAIYFRAQSTAGTVYIYPGIEP